MSEQEAAFPKVWESFCSLGRVADGRHDTPAWRSHDAVFAVCMIRVPITALNDDLARCRAALARLPGVRVHPDHFLHISLQELGFVTAAPRHPDEISPAALEEFVSMAASPISERPPFVLTLGGANSFKDAPFLEVHDDEESSRLHQRLFEIAAPPISPTFPYLPHSTIAHYTEPALAAPAIEVLSKWRDARFGEFEVTEVEIATMTIAEPYPPFQPFAVFPLVG
ncbi:MAG: 2'-5' RNA ligase family protein [Chloroflexota bacterium]|nr:2'-5' RNA ligase family protein [Chloroflexota bacterium]